MSDQFFRDYIRFRDRTRNRLEKLELWEQGGGSGSGLPTPITLDTYSTHYSGHIANTNSSDVVAVTTQWTEITIPTTLHDPVAVRSDANGHLTVDIASLGFPFDGGTELFTCFGKTILTGSSDVADIDLEFAIAVNGTVDGGTAVRFEFHNIGETQQMVLPWATQVLDQVELSVYVRTLTSSINLTVTSFDLLLHGLSQQNPMFVSLTGGVAPVEADASTVHVGQVRFDGTALETLTTSWSTINMTTFLDSDAVGVTMPGNAILKVDGIPPTGVVNDARLFSAGSCVLSVNPTTSSTATMEFGLAVNGTLRTETVTQHTLRKAGNSHELSFHWASLLNPGDQITAQIRTTSGTLDVTYESFDIMSWGYHPEEIYYYNVTDDPQPDMVLDSTHVHGQIYTSGSTTHGVTASWTEVVPTTTLVTTAIGTSMPSNGRIKFDLASLYPELGAGLQLFIGGMIHVVGSSGSPNSRDVTFAIGVNGSVQADTAVTYTFDASDTSQTMSLPWAAITPDGGEVSLFVQGPVGFTMNLNSLNIIIYGYHEEYPMIIQANVPGAPDVVLHDINDPLWHDLPLSWTNLSKSGSSLGDLGDRSFLHVTDRQYTHLINRVHDIKQEHTGTGTSGYGVLGFGPEPTKAFQELVSGSDGTPGNVILRTDANGHLILNNLTGQVITGTEGNFSTHVDTPLITSPNQIALRLASGSGEIATNDLMRTHDPVWQSGISGMGLNFATGAIDARTITADSMFVDTFIAMVAQAKVGRLLVTPSLTKISRDYVLPDVGSESIIYCRNVPGHGNMQAFADGDHVMLPVYDLDLDVRSRRGPTYIRPSTGGGNPQPVTYYTQAFDGPGWPVELLRTGTGNSLVQDDTVAQIDSIDGGSALRENNIANAHVHFTDDGNYDGSTLTDYVITGRFWPTFAGADIGFTMFSDYPNSDTYYRIRRFGDGGAYEHFHVDNHGVLAGNMTGTTASTYVPGDNPGMWHYYRIEVEDTGTRTEIRARFWLDGSPEPATWDIDCYDDNVDRRSLGTFGYWLHNSNTTYYDDLLVRSLADLPGDDHTITITKAELSLENYAHAYVFFTTQGASIDPPAPPGDWAYVANNTSALGYHEIYELIVTDPDLLPDEWEFISDGAFVAGIAGALQLGPSSGRSRFPSDMLGGIGTEDVLTTSPFREYRNGMTFFMTYEENLAGLVYPVGKEWYRLSYDTWGSNGTVSVWMRETGTINIDYDDDRTIDVVLPVGVESVSYAVFSVEGADINAEGFTVAQGWGTVRRVWPGDLENDEQAYVYRHWYPAEVVGMTSQADNEAFSFGKDGEGYVELNALDPDKNSPYMQAVVRGVNPWENQTVIFRGGRIKGIGGAVGENGVFIQGGQNYRAKAEISDGVARFTNIGLQLWNGEPDLSTQKVWIQSTGTVWIGQDVNDPAQRQFAFDPVAGTLSIKADVQILNPGDINTGDLTNDAGWTAGATWGSDLGNVPPRFGDSPASAGLYLTASRLGYWDGDKWTAYFTNAGNFYFGSNTSANRIQWDGTQFAGYNNSNVKQWWADVSDGKMYGGGGNVILDTEGVTVVTYTSFSASNRFSFDLGARENAFTGGRSWNGSDYQLMLSSRGNSGSAWGSIALRARHADTFDWPSGDGSGGTFVVTPENSILLNIGLNIAAHPNQVNIPVSPGRLRLSDIDEDYAEFYLDGNDVKLRRPDGTIITL